MTALQNHIHLSDALGSGPENAPDHKWKVTDRQVPITLFASVNRSLKGRLLFSRLLDSGGDPIVLYDYHLTLKVTEEELATLNSYVGKIVYFCDHYHANDGADHTADIKVMAFAQRDTPKPANTVMVYYLVDIVLVDGNTVA